MKKLLLIIIIVLNTHFCQCQEEFFCYLENPETQKKSLSCEYWNTYKYLDPFDTPIKHISITIHVLAKADGTSNIPNASQGINYLEQDVMTALNERMANFEEMHIPTTSPFVEDSRIRYVLDNIYFWETDYGWQFQQSHAYGDSLYNMFIASPGSIVQNKNNSIHIFLSGSSTGSKGRASGIGDKDWITLSGIYQAYLGGNVNIRGFIHELGHSIGLYHSWGFDGISDTPLNNNCWNLDPADVDCDEIQEVSNNIMDYNAFKNTLTLGQLIRAHHCLLGNLGNTIDCVIGTISINTPTIIGNNFICDTESDYDYIGLQLGVEVNSDYTSNISANSCGMERSFYKNTIINEEGTIFFSFNYGLFGSSDLDKQVWLGDFQSLNHEECDVSSISYISAEIVQIPGINCNNPDATIDYGETVTIYCSELLLGPGFEVESGGSLNVVLGDDCN